jgi:hypothetical protein
MRATIAAIFLGSQTASFGAAIKKLSISVFANASYIYLKNNFY